MKRTRFKFVITNFILVFFGSVMFSLSHPNYFNKNGIPQIAYFAIIPFFLLIKRNKLLSSSVLGAISGVLSYLLFNFWIISFHPIAIYIIMIKYAVLYFFLFFILSLIESNFNTVKFLLQTALWIGFEYIKTLGFLGYPYGIMGYTQWENSMLIRSASIFGVWGISFLVIFPSALISEFIWIYINNGQHVVPIKIKNIGKITVSVIQNAKAKKLNLQMYIWILAMLLCIVYGICVKKDFSHYPKAKIALIQPNRDPWIGNSEIYKANLEQLKNLSNEVIKKENNLDLIVWPETAFIPRIKWHYKYSQNRNSTFLVRELLDFLNKQNTPFLIGNDDAEVHSSYNLSYNYENIEEYRVDYNAALLFLPKKNVLPPTPYTYRKTKLVPFTEYFPYKEQFPFIYNFLKKQDIHFWEKGEDYSIFTVANFKFGTPICFEDCFGYISAHFVKNGADLIINITNDAWANSVVAQYQHLAMSVFRAVENNIPVVRAAISGQTAYIDSNGIVQDMLAPHISDSLIVEVPIITAHKQRHTIYTFAGDYFAKFCLILSAAAIICVFFQYLKKKQSVRGNVQQQFHRKNILPQFFWIVPPSVISVQDLNLKN